MLTAISSRSSRCAGSRYLRRAFDDRHENALGLDVGDGVAEGAEQLDAHDLEVGEVVAVVHDAGGVGLGVAHAHARRKT